MRVTTGQPAVARPAPIGSRPTPRILGWRLIGNEYAKCKRLGGYTRSAAIAVPCVDLERCAATHAVSRSRSEAPAAFGAELGVFLRARAVIGTGGMRDTRCGMRGC